MSTTSEVLRAVQSVVSDPVGARAQHEPEFRGNELAYVSECIESGWVSSVGSFVDRFERDLATVTGATAVVATANGTAALHMCLLLVGVRPGDEVLVPTLTFVATANAISYCHAVPHFIDVADESLAVDFTALDAYLGDVATLRGGECVNKQTGRVIRALVVLHPLGHPADMDAAEALAAKWKLELIEDAAESLGSLHRGRHTGTRGRVSALSFNGNKIVTTGGGGAIMTMDTALGLRAKHLTTTAKLPHRWEFQHDEVGFNYRLPNLNAALGCAQLERLPSFLARKRALAARYAQALAPIQGVRFFREPSDCESNYWLCSLVLDSALAGQRDAVLTALNDAGLAARPVWNLMHTLPMYASMPRMPLTAATSLAARVISLPSSPRFADAYAT